jgi:hypothetical protein
MLAAAHAAREAGSSPNTALCGAVALIGPKLVEGAGTAVQTLLDVLRQSGITDLADPHAAVDARIAATTPEQAGTLLAAEPDPLAEAMLAGARARGVVETAILRYLTGLAAAQGGHPSADAVLAAICLHLAWRPLLHKRISVTTLANLPWHLRVAATLVGASVSPARQGADRFGGVPVQSLIDGWSFTETAYLALLGCRPDADGRFAFSVLLGLTASNGPGTISAQGAKGAVSADGPEMPERVQINKGYLGFLSHTGFAHGGNGFEAMQFLIARFSGRTLADPGDPHHGLDLVRIAADYAVDFKLQKAKAKAVGNLSYAKIPCVNHPIFKGKEVNLDPREVYVRELFQSRGSYNIFHEFYHDLVHALASYGVSSNVYCVNIDAVIAVILLKILWRPYVAGEVDASFLEYGAFTTFLYGRAIGTAAEIEDHMTRGRNMDTRTAASQCRFVA